MKRFFFSAFFMLLVIGLSAQVKMKTIKGFVNSKNTFEAIEGVQVFCEDSNYQTRTGSNGAYVLPMPRKSKWIHAFPNYKILFHLEQITDPL